MYIHVLARLCAFLGVRVIALFGHLHVFLVAPVHFCPLWLLVVPHGVLLVARGEFWLLVVPRGVLLVAHVVACGSSWCGIGCSW